MSINLYPILINTHLNQTSLTSFPCSLDTLVPIGYTSIKLILIIALLHISERQLLKCLACPTKESIHCWGSTARTLISCLFSPILLFVIILVILKINLTQMHIESLVILDYLKKLQYCAGCIKEFFVNAFQLFLDNTIIAYIRVSMCCKLSQSVATFKKSLIFL